jgi:prophage antirepressor-like protein
MVKIQIFNHPQFGDIRTTGTPDNPEFCAMDLCRALGYTNGRKAVADHCDEWDVTKRDTPTKNQWGTEVIQKITFVNESGLYSLVFGSKLDSAKQFKHWVTSEVLPSIRKHGAYATEATIDSIIADPDNGIRLLQALKEEREQRKLAESKAALLEEVTKVQAPKVEYFEHFMSAEHGETNAGIREVVKQAHIKSEKRFISWMIQKQILFRQKKDNRLQPYAEYAKCFDYKDVHDKDNDWSGKHLKFNPYGKLHIVKKYHDQHPEEFEDIRDLFNN